MDEKDMQAMMEQMQKMQDCMQQIDYAEITTAEQHAAKISAEVKTLCAEGKHDQAREQVITFSKKLAKIPALQELRRCSEMATGMTPMIPLLDQYKADNLAQYDVCQQ